MPSYHDEAFTLLLRSGEALIVGGTTASLSEVFDSSIGRFNAVAEPCGCANLAAVLLSSGRVLAAGGTTGYHPVTIDSAEIYEPLTRSRVPTGSMSVPRDTPTITLLSNGQVLVAGGEDISGGIATELASAELYTP